MITVSTAPDAQHTLDCRVAVAIASDDMIRNVWLSGPIATREDVQTLTTAVSAEWADAGYVGTVVAWHIF